MAVYRTVHTNFWEDAKVLDEMNIEERYFWLYLLTNPHTNQIGCFEISKRQMKSETDFEVKTINTFLDKFENELNLIIYSKETKEIFIKNWHKYNWSKSPKVKTCIEKEFSNVKDDKIRKKLYEMLVKVYGIDSLSIQYQYSMDSLGIKEKEKEKETKKENNSSSSSNDVTIYDFVQENFGRLLCPAEYEEIGTWEDNELTRYAIKQAVLNNKFFVKYISGILTAYERENIKTVQQAQEREKEFKKSKNKQNKNYKTAQEKRFEMYKRLEEEYDNKGN